MIYHDDRSEHKYGDVTSIVFRVVPVSIAFFSFSWVLLRHTKTCMGSRILTDVDIGSKRIYKTKLTCSVWLDRGNVELKWNTLEDNFCLKKTSTILLFLKGIYIEKMKPSRNVCWQRSENQMKESASSKGKRHFYGKQYCCKLASFSQTIHAWFTGVLCFKPIPLLTQTSSRDFLTWGAHA